MKLCVKQLDLLYRERLPGYAEPMARRTDHISSHEAADRAERSGLVVHHEALILEALADGDELSAAEIARRIGLAHVQVARRMKGMERKGLVYCDQEFKPLRWGMR